MKLKDVQHGWVILSHKGKFKEGPFILGFTYSRTRTEAIKKWRLLWAEPLTWDAYKKQGFKCVKATKTISVE